MAKGRVDRFASPEEAGGLSMMMMRRGQAQWTEGIHHPCDAQGKRAAHALHQRTLTFASEGQAVRRPTKSPAKAGLLFRQLGHQVAPQ
jgi:hypothetical protein